MEQQTLPFYNKIEVNVDYYINKWFIKDLDGNYDSSDIHPENWDEAWEKTFCNWYLKTSGYTYKMMGCGLCDLTDSVNNTDSCKGCPIREYTGKDQCKETPYYDYYDNSTTENILKEIIFLCKVANWWYNEK
jgi:hypothetical protein